MRRLMLASVAMTIGILVTSGCSAVRGGGVQATREFTMTAPWADYERVIVHSRNGGVDLVVADVPGIEIDGKLHVRGLTQAEAEANLDRLEVLAEADPLSAATFRVELKVPVDLKQKSSGASFRIKVPKACAAEIDTSNGSIHVERLAGTIVLGTSNGAVHAADIDGNLDIDTTNGRVQLDDIRGDADADTSNGAVTIEKITGKCDVRTSNGSIAIADARGNIRADTSNGGIRVDASPPADGVVLLDTSNASIKLTLPAAIAAELDLDTSNGTVRVDFGDIPKEIRRQSKTRVNATVNGGGGRIRADTTNGSITVNFRE